MMRTLLALIPLVVACNEAPPINILVNDDDSVELTLGDVHEEPPLFDGFALAPSCLGNNDGTIEAGEMPTVLGAFVTYRVNAPDSPVTVNSKGGTFEGGHAWDFRGVEPLQAVGIEVQDPQDFWFAKHFPDAEYATPVSLWDTELLGLFASAPDSVLMLGLASIDSPDATNQYTLLVYDEPLEVYRFPLTPGATWEQTVTFADATLQGIKNAGSEHYHFVVDGRGTVLLPDFILENTLRVRLTLDQTFVVSQGQPTISHTQFFFVHECLGEVARIVSAPNEPNPEFTTASEFRRLGL